MKALLLTTLAALAAPAAAFGADPAMTVRDVPLHGGARTLAAATPRFNMVGVHWRGPGRVQLRWRAASGAWSAWQTADDDITPDAKSAENRDPGWRLGSPMWTGTDAHAIRFRTTGRVTALRAYYIWTPVEQTPTRRIAIANSPPIIPRLSWGADESIRRAAPLLAPSIKYAVVHHTAGSNNYTAAQSASIVNGIYVYHVKGNGWNDIGYNFLVDKYGQVFEGRFGGYDKNVIGAHAEGFNTGSTGVAVLGSYGTSKISAAALTSLEQLLSWRLDVAHIDPQATLTVASGGNPRFGSGVPVDLRAIAGHRDTNFTDCPGDALYAELPQIAKDVAALGGPKIYSPAAAGKLEGPIRFTGRVSSSLPWSVTVTDPSGATVAQGTGTGTSVDWTWDATAAPVQRYTWTMTTPNARAATGTIGAAALSVALQKVTASPNVVAPGGPAATISYTLTAASLVTATLIDPLGQTVATLLNEQKPAGAQTLSFAAGASTVPGAYAIQIVASVNGKTATATVPLAIDDSFNTFTSTQLPKGGGAALGFNLTRGPVTVTLQVKQGTDVVLDVPPATLSTGPQTIDWNGTLTDGSHAADGVYTLALSVQTPFSTFTKTVDVTLDATPPKLTALSYKSMRFRVSEPVKLTLYLGARKYTRVLKKATTTQFWFKTKPGAYRVVAVDAGGNVATLRYRASHKS